MVADFLVLRKWKPNMPKFEKLYTDAYLISDMPIYIDLCSENLEAQGSVAIK